MRGLDKGGMKVTCSEMKCELRGKLIVSCQAPKGTSLRDPWILAVLARVAVEAGAAGIRADGAATVAAIRKAVTAPIIGIAKQELDDGGILITPSLESARELLEAGADMIAVDCSRRGQSYGALERLEQIRREFNVPVLADIATFEEARQAEQCGADFILTTLRGYTAETEHVKAFDLNFVRDLVAALKTPVIAEGRIGSPEQAAAALEAGAWAVIVGTAITRPDLLVKKYVAEMRRASSRAEACIIGVDLGATNTKSALVRADGRLLWRDSRPTPAEAGRDGLLEHLRDVVARCGEAASEMGLQSSAIGIATAGWVDPNEGNVVYATGNLPGWAGAAIRSELEHSAGLPVAVENDANAMAVAERRFGAARKASNFLCLTLGTGVGGGCYVGGVLNRGAHFLGNAFGHIKIESPGLPCTCGQSGCLEVYANAAALIRYAGNGYSTALEVTEAARAGDQAARAAVRTYAGYLARGLSTLVHALDPELVVLSGGVAEENHLLLAELRRELSRLVIGWTSRCLRLEISSVARFGGVMGAAAVALEESERRATAGVATL